MNVISRSTLRDFWQRFPEVEQVLKAWYHEAKSARWGSGADIKARFPSASIINSERVVFNIGGNKYRLVVRINYQSGAIFIRFVGTHREYDKIDVEKI